MRVKGLTLLTDALATFGVGALGERTDAAQIDQAARVGSMKLESLALSERYVPGVTSIDHVLTAGQSVYTIGPASGSDIHADATPERIEAWSILPEAGSDVEDPQQVTTSVIVWQQRDANFPTEASGALLYVPGGRVTEFNRSIQFFPEPANDAPVRLYAWVPSITTITPSATYDLERGVAEVVVSQIAASLIPYYMVEGETSRNIERRADLAMDRLQRRNTRYHRRAARIPGRWIGSPSAGDRRARRRF